MNLSASVALVSVKKTSILYITITLLLHLLYFVRSGYINLESVIMRESGINGYVWPSSASSRRYEDAVPTAYSLQFSDLTVTPSFGPYYRWYYRPLRD